MQPKLDVYISDDCPTCVQTKDLVDMVLEKHTEIEINLINLSDPNAVCPDWVFAVPTFTYGQRIVFLGNPSLQELDAYFLEIQD